MENELQEMTETGRFKSGDVLLSVTDKRGVITSVNDAFCRVADMTREDLLKAPHNVIRHPDMPQSVFRLVWKTLQEGAPIGAYLLNQASDGQTYWVYAIFMPIDDGYLCASIKPSTARLDKIKTLYAQLRGSESNDQSRPEDVDADLIAGVVDKECNSYTQFMSCSLKEEVAARTIELDRPLSVELTAVINIQNSADKAIRLTKDVHRLFKQTTQVPFNMRLQAIRMEGRDGPIGVISSNHQVMTQSLEMQVSELRAVAERGNDPISDSHFAVCTRLILGELAEQTQQEQNPIVPKDVLKKLENQTHQAAQETAIRIQELLGLCKNFKRSMSRLELTRIMCKIEQARFNGDASGLEAIAEELLKTEQSFSKGIAEIDGLGQEILFLLKPLNSPTQQAA